MTVIIYETLKVKQLVCLWWFNSWDIIVPGSWRWHRQYKLVRLFGILIVLALKKYMERLLYTVIVCCSWLACVQLIHVLIIERMLRHKSFKSSYLKSWNISLMRININYAGGVLLLAGLLVMVIIIIICVKRGMLLSFPWVHKNNCYYTCMCMVGCCLFSWANCCPLEWHDSESIAYTAHMH